ncbi:hypothetical protein [Scytonema millei]|uniref:Uncharacterized protein n=1 Tax=Scytonema millei VB511283 TaxID=1245923 RepID=A0A9X5E7M1_9CYAN|nr:hypothetical protein [Scytonema millei]NHC36624.1 hypothetical protein [Scytonema millei VB511283]
MPKLLVLSPIILRLNPPVRESKFVGAGFAEAPCIVTNNSAVKPTRTEEI